MQLQGLSVLFLIVCVAVEVDAVKFTESTRTFSSASKGGSLLPYIEETVFEMSDGPGFVTQQWYTSFPHGSRVKIYIDNEDVPSIDADLLLLVSVGNCSAAEQHQSPWSNRHFGHLANKGGIYTNFRIPFSSSIRVTVTSSISSTDLYWFIIRFMIGVPLVVDGFELPNNTRLRLYNIERQDFAPYEFVHGANVQNSAGWLYMAAVSANSSNFHYLEACFRVYIDDQRVQFLSSGTEDFFLSAYYFNTGIYHSDAAGLTCLSQPGTMSAYKMFAEDPVLFKKSLRLDWRCGEKQGELEGCPNTYQRSNPNAGGFRGNPIPETMTASMYVWVYEFPSMNY